MGNYQKNKGGNSNDKKSSKEYVNGIFVSQHEGQYGEYFSVGINKENFIKELESLEPNEKGMVNFFMSAQKSNPNKLSVYRLTGGGNREKSETSYKQPGQSKATLPDDDDGLPF